MAKKENMKYTNEELNAMRINALLSGVDPSTIQNVSADEEDDFEIEIVDEPSTTTKTKRRKTKQEKSSSATDFTTKTSYIDELDAYKNIKRNAVLPVKFGQHDIHYKEQLWNIPTRTVIYNLEVVKMPKVAKDISDIMNSKSDDEREKASSGQVRYIKLVTYESIPHAVSVLGYGKIFTDKDGKLKTRVYVDKKTVSNCTVNYDTLVREFKTKMQEVVTI